MILTFLILIILGVTASLLSWLILYRYNLLGSGIDHSNDPEWLIKFREKSRWQDTE